MWIRILIAGIAGGVLVFVTGAFSHAALGLQGRTIENLPDEATFVEQVKGQKLRHGLYGFPGQPTSKDAKEREREFAEVQKRFKAGPAGFLLIAPTGEEMMGGATLGMEFATNAIAALLAAWILSLAAADVGFGKRWLAVLAMGIFAWFSLSASYGIWYRFPHDFIHDEFYCAVLEWGVAGLAIAAIVRKPIQPAQGTKHE
ncbi:MAG TPA: hypothetical protein VFB80_22680 [Pirellulaceae bacterium]|nr:hypothetical protein [Pirellulaceae bacterium]